MIIRGQGADWKAYLRASTLNGLIGQICIDAGKGRLFSSARIEGGKHVWALTQSWLFEVNGSGSFVIASEDAFKAVDMLTPTDTYSGEVGDGELLRAIRLHVRDSP